MTTTPQPPEPAPTAGDPPRSGAARPGSPDADDPAQGQLPRLIKRYANRKLYDTAMGGFTSLSRIKSLVRDGVEVVVLDHRTGVDRTVETLSRTLSRRRAADAPEPADDEQPDLDLLTRLIRTPPERVVEVMDGEDYDLATIQALRDEVRTLADTLDQMIADAPAPDAQVPDAPVSRPAPPAADPRS